VTISAGDLTGIADGTARRVIAEGRSIAPCLDSLSGEPRNDAIAILEAVARELVGRGSQNLKRQRIGVAEADYYDVRTAFSDGDRAALRALCSATTNPAPGSPVGSFPIEDPFRRIWPERQNYT